MRYSLAKRFSLDILNMPMGVLVGFLVCGFLGSVLNADIEPQAKAIFRDYFVPVLIPLLVSAFAVSGVFTNIASQREKDEDTRQRKLLAARAKLPLALSSAYEAFEAGIRHSITLEAIDEDDDEAWSNLQIESMANMRLATDAVDTFLEVIENHDDPKVAQRLSGLLREYQVFMARWLGEFESRAEDHHMYIKLPEDVRQRTVSWAYLTMIAASLFDYARGDEALSEVTEDGIRGLLNRKLPAGHAVGHYEAEIGLYARTFTRRFP